MGVRFERGRLCLLLWLQLLVGLFHLIIFRMRIRDSLLQEDYGWGWEMGRLIKYGCALKINQNITQIQDYRPIFYLFIMPAKAKAKQLKADTKKQNDVSASKPKNTPAPVKSGRAASKSKKDEPKVVTPAKKDTPAKKVSPPKQPSPAKKVPAKGKKAVSPKKAASPPKDPPKRSGTAADDKNKDVTSGVKKTKSDEQIVKVITKGGAAVDGLVPNKQGYRVYQESGKTYSATLNQSNLDQNNNKFYIIQILQNESSGNLFVWNRWGRVGVPGQNALKGPMPKDAAIREYNSKHHDKTVKGDYRQIEIKYDDEEEKKEQKKPTKNNKNVQSKMDVGLQKLINLIFDVNIMNNTMKEIGYDAKKMPLGRLGDSTIKEAYGVLNKLSEAIKKKDRNLMSSLSGDFYSLIPHDFGFQKMSNFILDNDEKVKQKLKMLQTISDLKITSKLLDQKTDDNEAILDQNYKKLGCGIKTLDEKSAEFKLLNEYFENTKGSFSKVKIGEIYEVVRDNEQKEYNTKIGNNMLLWHGSRVSNFVGILSQGLRIAPPEAPVSGYLFGKGIYLADMAEKSIHYCRSYGQDAALILLIEGAIGQPNILLHSNYNAKQEMEKNKKHSTKCHGSKAPPPQTYVNHKNVIIPKGVPKPTNSGSYMGHNEYIVYNMNQARIRYVLRMNMNGS